MKRSLLFFGLLTIIVRLSATTFSISAVIPKGEYRLVVQNEHIALTIADTTLHRATIKFPRRWTLNVATRSLDAFFSTLGARRMRTVGFGRGNYAFYLLTDAYQRPALIATIPSITIGVLPPAGKPEESGVLWKRDSLVVGRWAASSKRARALVEGSYSASSGLTLYKEISLHFGILALTLTHGPESKMRHTSLSLRAQTAKVRALLVYTQTLGARPIYSGSSQEAKHGYESELSYGSGLHIIALGHKRQVHYDSSVKRTIEYRWFVRYRYKESEFTLSNSSSGIGFVSKEGGRKVELRNRAIHLRWAYSRPPWSFEIQIGPEGACSLLWQFTYSTDRGS